MLRKIFRVLGDVAAVEIGDAEVEKYIKEVGKVEDGEILSVEGIAKSVLHFQIDAEIPERLHQ